jgi:hypothetical protein
MMLVNRLHRLPSDAEPVRMRRGLRSRDSNLEGFIEKTPRFCVGSITSVIPIHHYTTRGCESCVPSNCCQFLTNPPSSGIRSQSFPHDSVFSVLLPTHSRISSSNFFFVSPCVIVTSRPDGTSRADSISYAQHERSRHAPPCRPPRFLQTLDPFTPLNAC